MSFRVVKFIITIAILVFSLLLYKSFAFLEFNNDHWLPEQNVYQEDLNYLEKEFQPGFGCVLVVEFSDSFFSNKNIAFLKRLINKIEDIDYIFKVNSPLDATVIINKDDMLTIQTYEEALVDGNITSIKEYQTLFKASPYYGKLISKDHQRVSISLSIDKKNDGSDLMRRVSAVEDIQSLLQTFPDDVTGFMSGDAAIYYEMDSSTRSNLLYLLPLAFILLILVAWLFLKQIRSVLIVVIPTLINLGLVPIFIVLLGHYITIINVTLFILVLVITVADGIHMLNYWEHYKLKQSQHPIADTIRATWLPCFITSITTAVGFGSFVTSSIIPLNQYGMQAFFVMVFSYIIVMTGVPFLLRLIPPKVRSIDDVLLFPKFISFLIKLITNRTKLITLGTLILTLIISQFLWFAQTETSFISVFFNNSHPVRQNVQLVDDHLAGSGRLDVILRAKTPDAFKSIDTFQDLRQRVDFALEYPLIKSAHDISIPVKMIHKGFGNGQSVYPKSDVELEQELLFLEFSRGETKTDVLSSVVDFNYQNTRIEFFTDQLPTSKIEDLIDYLNNVFSDISFAKPAITGSQFLSYVLGKYVLQSQFITVLITLSFVWILFVALFGIKLGTVGMFPNIITMLITLSLLPITNTPFDFATVLISSVTLGLCVDDTIHWLHYFELCRKDGDDIPAIQTSRMMFKPLFLTSIILGIGFGALGFANLVILKKFGLFTMFAIGLAFLSDILILPAIIRYFKLTK